MYQVCAEHVSTDYMSVSIYYVYIEYVSTATRYMCRTRELFTYSNIVPYVSLLMYHVYSEYVSTHYMSLSILYVYTEHVSTATRYVSSTICAA